MQHSRKLYVYNSESVRTEEIIFFVHELSQMKTQSRNTHAAARLYRVLKRALAPL